MHIHFGMTETQKEHIELTVQQESEGLLNFIRYRIPDEEDARDILQDVFYQLVIGYPDIKNLENVTSWLYRVARNKIIDSYRKKKPEPFSKQVIKHNGDEEGAPLMLQDILPSLSADPEDEMMRSIIMVKIEEALEELPEDQREVFIMHEFEDISFNEISAMTGEKVNTLLSRKRYAVLFLRNKLQELYNQIKY